MQQKNPEVCMVFVGHLWDISDEKRPFWTVSDSNEKVDNSRLSLEKA